MRRHRAKSPANLGIRPNKVAPAAACNSLYYKSLPILAWTLADQARSLHSGELFVGGGLTAENVAQAIVQARPSGVDVAGGIEGPDGFKDRGRVRAFVRAARGASR